MSGKAEDNATADATTADAATEPQKQSSSDGAASMTQDEFAKAVRTCFDRYTSRGMEPNEACALALKVVSGMADEPVSYDDILSCLENQPDPSYVEGVHTVGNFFGKPESVQAAFWTREPAPQQSNSSSSSLSAASESYVFSIDYAAMERLFAAMTKLKHSVLNKLVAGATQQLVITISRSKPTSNPGLMRQLMFVLLNPLLEDSEFYPVTAITAFTIVDFGADIKDLLTKELARLTRERLLRVVTMLQQYITITLYQNQAITGGVEAATMLLGLLHSANHQSTVLNYSEFYNDAVNSEEFNIREDFRRWKNPFKHTFSFCRYPFVYDPASKMQVLQYENQLQQISELQNAVAQSLYRNNGNLQDAMPFLILRVRRGQYLIQDTLVQINRAKNNDSLRKPLKVKFVGEEGVDEGGVQKEFFQLIVRALFTPEYGMFKYDERTHLYWFQPSKLDMATEFELVGIVIGLAIYNSHILEFAFPNVLYKKLMSAGKCEFDDLNDFQPDLHQNLQKLLEYPGDVEDLGLYFQVEQEIGFGEVEAVDLIPGGGEVAVNNSNREEYVRLYTQHVLETSIDTQFSAFQKGFLRLCSGEALKWFQPQELEMLICGSQHLDMEALQSATIYDDGYTKDSEVIQWFWDIVHQFPEENKKKLLFFVTGSDRVPIKGLAHLNPPFVISRAGAHSDRLPSAHTCFNHLLIPQYDTKEVLQERLELAIQNAEGFGLM